VAADAGNPGTRGIEARRKLGDAVTFMSADQSEHVLARLREADYSADHELVGSLLQQLERKGGKRKANAARKWFGAESAVDERRAQRQQNGTLEEQRGEYGLYVQRLREQLETGTRGNMLTRQARAAGMDTEAILTSTPDTMRKHLSEESLRELAKIGPPLSFDAWRYQNLGARDRRAVASWKRRTAGYFSEHG
jgi:hypothetical protein